MKIKGNISHICESFVFYCLQAEKERCKKNGIKSKFSSQYNGKVNLQFIVMDGMVSYCLCSRVRISPKMSLFQFMEAEATIVQSNFAREIRILKLLSLHYLTFHIRSSHEECNVQKVQKHFCLISGRNCIHIDKIISIL